MTNLQDYFSRSPEELDDFIVGAKAKLGDDLLILGHHYQKDEIIKHADITGDSLYLSKAAAESNAKHIIFCGVHFMAQTAAMLVSGEQRVYLPDESAGCPMADMCDVPAIELAWSKLTDIYGDNSIIPITYVNSTAEVKAFVGGHGGTCVTSTNAPKVVEWALLQNKRVFFIPDQHLGRNTAYSLGVSLDEMLVWNRAIGELQVDQYHLRELESAGQSTATTAAPTNSVNENQFETLQQCQNSQLESPNAVPTYPSKIASPDQHSAAKLILWDGYCSVHQQFTKADVDNVRRQHQGIKVIVHPECAFDVVQAADDSGSTNKLIDLVLSAPNGTKFAIGTDNNLVGRLSDECKAANNGKEVHFLSTWSCPCVMMNRIRLPHLAANLDDIMHSVYDRQITVDDNTTSLANVALNKMFELS